MPPYPIPSCSACPASGEPHGAALHLAPTRSGGAAARRYLDNVLIRLIWWRASTRYDSVRPIHSQLSHSASGGACMASHRVLTLSWGGGIFLVVCLYLPLMATAQQKSDADLARDGAIALATAHGEKPRYGGKFLSVGNEEVPFYDMHQTSLGGIYAATAPAYNCLIRTSPYDPKGQEIIPELADSWEISDGGKTITFYLHKGVKWHDGAPFSAADVKYTIERIMHP